jgi:hypothetical protein
MLIGRHGVGKTEMVKQAFESSGLNWLYFSASTMDPWIDLVGVPRKVDDDGGSPYIELVRPKAFRDDVVEAIFLDEYNRAPTKVRNATMELIQFRSINGHKFNKLKMVWIAINPNDGEYDTDGMDPAQEDRFPIKLEVPFKPDKEYFAGKYGAHQANAAVMWWEALKSDMQKLISPRRLDYALNIFNLGGNLRGVVLPEKSGTDKLVDSLKKEPAELEFQRLVDAKDTKGLRSFLSDPNNYATCERIMVKNANTLAICFPEVSMERQSALVSKYETARQVVASDPERYRTLLESIANAGSNQDTSDFANQAISASNNKNSVTLSNHLSGLHTKNVTPSYIRNTKAKCSLNISYTPTGYQESDNQIHPSDWDDVKYIESRLTGSTPNKKVLANSVIRHMKRGRINTNLACRALSIFNIVSERTYDSTVVKLYGFAQCVGSIIHYLMSSKKVTISDLVDTYPYLMTGPVYKIAQNENNFVLNYNA